MQMVKPQDLRTRRLQNQEAFSKIRYSYPDRRFLKLDLLTSDPSLDAETPDHPGRSRSCHPLR